MPGRVPADGSKVKSAPGTIAVWSDLGCPWSHAVVWRLWDARRRLGLADQVRFDHHAFPLELFNNEPTPRIRNDAEWPIAQTLAPRAGWQAWWAPAETYPVTMLPPMEAVQAAKLGSLAAAEQLDRGLRHAFWAESRCISLRHVILEVASTCESLDLDRFVADYDAGLGRRPLFDDWATARGDAVRGSAHLFAPDGTNDQNPGITIEWADGAYAITADEPTAIDDLVRRAAG
jgi:predicted DsbA family dithiol-disulfide isomerase